MDSPLDLQQIGFRQAGSTQLPSDPLGRGSCINLTQSGILLATTGQGSLHWIHWSRLSGDEEDWEQGRPPLHVDVWIEDHLASPVHDKQHVAHFLAVTSLSLWLCLPWWYWREPPFLCFYLLPIFGIVVFQSSLLPAPPSCSSEPLPQSSQYYIMLSVRKGGDIGEYNTF